MISIHDNEVEAYIVDLRNRTIRLDTIWSYGEKRERTVVEFRGVTAFAFDGSDIHQNVLLDIVEKSPQHFEIQTAIGLEGWVEADKMEFIPLEVDL